MITYTPSIAELSSVILVAYHTLRPESYDDSQVNQALVAHLGEWWQSSDRRISNCAAYSINRFVDDELDFAKRGNRGIGRIIDDGPEFGEKYRATLQTLSREAIHEFKCALCDEITVGYCFAEYLIECISGQRVPKVELENAVGDVFDQWIESLHSGPRPSEFDVAFALENSTSYFDVKWLWSDAAGYGVHFLFIANRIPVDEFAKYLVRQYFDAGIMLRVTEMRSMSANDNSGSVSGDALSAEREELGFRTPLALVEDVYKFRNMPTTRAEVIAALTSVGLTLADVNANQDVVFEAGIARNIRRACEALGIAISPQQSLTLAKHRRVGSDRYRNGISLTDYERHVAVKMEIIYMKAQIEKQGHIFTEEHARDCERGVRFGERGLTVAHRIGEASGCFQVVLFALFSTGAFVFTAVWLVK